MYEPVEEEPMSEESLQGIAWPLEWHIPDDLPSQLATNLVVQHTGHEFILSFFQVSPPFILGGMEEIKQQLADIESVRAECVARIVVAGTRMPGFVRALQSNLETFLANQEDVGAEEER